MTPEDIEVRQALTRAGHAGRPLNSRSELHSTLRDLYHEDPDNEDFVDGLRSILDVADRREWAAEAKAEFMTQDGIKGCPSCNAQPKILQGNRIQCDACENQPSAEGETLIDSLLSWNDDEDWQLMGAPVDPIKNRSTYPHTAHTEKVRAMLTAEGY